MSNFRIFKDTGRIHEDRKLKTAPRNCNDTPADVEPTPKSCVTLCGGSIPAEIVCTLSIGTMSYDFTLVAGEFEGERTAPWEWDLGSMPASCGITHITLSCDGEGNFTLTVSYVFAFGGFDTVSSGPNGRATDGWYSQAPFGDIECLNGGSGGGSINAFVAMPTCEEPPVPDPNDNPIVMMVHTGRIHEGKPDDSRRLFTGLKCPPAYGSGGFANRMLFRYMRWTGRYKTSTVDGVETRRRLFEAEKDPCCDGGPVKLGPLIATDCCPDNGLRRRLFITAFQHNPGGIGTAMGTVQLDWTTDLPPTSMCPFPLDFDDSAPGWQGQYDTFPGIPSYLRMTCISGAWWLCFTCGYPFSGHSLYGGTILSCDPILLQFGDGLTATPCFPNFPAAYFLVTNEAP